MNETLSQPYPGAPFTIILPRLKWRVLAWGDGTAITYTNALQAKDRVDFLNAPQLPGTGAVNLAPLPPQSGTWTVRQSPASRVCYVCWCLSPASPAGTVLKPAEFAL